MKKNILTTTSALFFSFFWSFQTNAGHDPKYPAYDFEPKVIYRSPELLESLARKPVSQPKVLSQKTKPKKVILLLKQDSKSQNKPSSLTSVNPEAIKKQDSGFSFGSLLMLAVFLAAIWFACRDRIPLAPTAGTTPKPRSKVTKPSAAKQKKDKGSGIQDLSDKVAQCQASTSKRTRCKRKTNLQLKQHTVKGSNCQFAVCKQHDSESFSPHPSAIKGV